VKLLWNDKDGGPDSKVWCWGIESKRFGSVLFLKFGAGSREAWHSHAFNAISWVLSGAGLKEIELGLSRPRVTLYHPSITPVHTYRETFHQVHGLSEATWVLSFRGPWMDEWREHNEHGAQTLTHGRKVVV
jgi:hypothetical protein